MLTVLATNAPTGTGALHQAGNQRLKKHELILLNGAPALLMKLT